MIDTAAQVPDVLTLTDDTILNCLLKAFKPNSAVVSLLLTERWKDGIEIETPTHGLQDFAVELVRPYEDRIAQLEATIREKDERIYEARLAIALSLELHVCDPEECNEECSVESYIAQARAIDRKCEDKP